MGSCTEGLWYGVPMVAIPQAVDQPSNADRLEAIGVGRYLRAISRAHQRSARRSRKWRRTRRCACGSTRFATSCIVSAAFTQPMRSRTPQTACGDCNLVGASSERAGNHRPGLTNGRSGRHVDDRRGGERGHGRLGVCGHGCRPGPCRTRQDEQLVQSVGFRLVRVTPVCRHSDSPPTSKQGGTKAESQTGPLRSP